MRKCWTQTLVTHPTQASFLDTSGARGDDLLVFFSHFFSLFLLHFFSTFASTFKGGKAFKQILNQIFGIFTTGRETD